MTPGDPQPGPDLLTLLWEAAHALRGVSLHMERNLGVSGPQRLVIREVARRSGITPGALAEVLGVHPSTITGLVERVVARGLIVREPRADDRRSVRLVATDAGRALLEKPGVTIESVVTEASTGLPDATREAAAHFLEVIARALRTAAASDDVAGEDAK